MEIDKSDLPFIATLIIAACGGLTWMLGKLFGVANHIDRLDIRMENFQASLEKTSRKADAAILHLARRGAISAVQQGIGDMNSPVVIHAEVRERARSLLGETAIKLRDLYRSMGREVNESDLFVELEIRFGQEIVEKICIPFNVNQSECMHIAAAVAKDE